MGRVNTGSATSAKQANRPECRMTSEEREKMEFLCQQITEERDPDRFDELVFALNELLDAKQQRSTPAQR
jgi:phage terminase large subunit-like protein